MKILDLEFKKVGISIENLINEYGNEKYVGIISNTRIKLENGKCIGKIILLLKPKKRYLVLNQIVEFFEDKVKYQHSFVGNENFYLISDHWIKPFVQEIKLEVPVKVLDSKTKEIITEMMELTYKQFQENRLLEFYEKYKYGLVAAYINFTKLFKNNPYWYSINASAKMYRIPSDYLVRFISKVDNQKRSIKTEWISHLNYQFTKKQTNLKIQNLIDKYNSYGQESKILNVKI